MIRMEAEEPPMPAGDRFLSGNTAESMREQPDGADPKAAKRPLAYIIPGQAGQGASEGGGIL